ncbi:sulfurtransferase [Nocardioides sp. Kera G14]|uniref:sulfurtransferase n=1 Tax=Nocardioides sp. Kera G14 TaxID=2884264 RepID=UPI001D127D70|nr:sulfurtransferase [Nocardioides sp. Kera G14]UDY24890.1 sulfurtransferase [Nocardioides sp. Kera G14]
MTVLITAAELAEALASPTPPVVLDVRWKLGGPPGHGDYLTGHIPGAVYVPLEWELATQGKPEDGRHPLPSVETLQEAARRWGVDDGDLVVAYDANGCLAAARLWWLLRWAGVADVRLLDGGLDAWTTEGYELTTDDVTPAVGDVTLTPGHLPVLPLDEVERYDGVLLDARAPERYRGESEPIDPKAGHIPGALNAPTGANLTADGHFLPADVLKAHFGTLGVDGRRPVAAYCGSGVTAAHEVAALAIAGIEASLYPGSWSQWSNLDRPVATE